MAKQLKIYQSSKVIGTIAAGSLSVHVDLPEGTYKVGDIKGAVLDTDTGTETAKVDYPAFTLANPQTPVLTVTAGDGKVDYSFTDSDTTITGYAVYSKASTDTNWGTPKNLAANTKAGTITGLTNGTAYDVTVVAKNAYGNSDQGAADATKEVTPVAPAPEG